jgi:formylglycine-generating enzyme required for sulfatase activity
MLLKMNQEYLNLDLHIGDHITAEFADHEEEGEFALPRQGLEGRLQTLQIAILETVGIYRGASQKNQDTAIQFGQALFEAVFSNERIRDLYSSSRREAENQNKGLRLRLQIDSPEVAKLPWEFLYDATLKEYLCLSPDTLIARRIKPIQPARPPVAVDRVRILGMMAKPKGFSNLNVDVEKQKLEEVLSPLESQGRLELVWVQGQQSQDLQKHIRNGTWHIFHFIGHGEFNPEAKTGQVILADENQKPHRVAADDFARILALQRSLRLVVLNSCAGADASDLANVHSSTAAALINRAIPAVLAMQNKISDGAAIVFARAFYDSLAETWSIDRAITNARIAVAGTLSGSLEWATPVLYLQRLDSVLFKFTQSTPLISSAKEKEPAPPAKVIALGGYKGISSPLLAELRNVLLECGPISDHQQLKAIFADASIFPWRSGLPETDDEASRVDSLIDYLAPEYDIRGENALVLFLRAVSNGVANENICHGQLLGLAELLEKELAGKHRLEPPREQPQLENKPVGVVASSLMTTVESPSMPDTPPASTDRPKDAEVIGKTGGSSESSYDATTEKTESTHVPDNSIAGVSQNVSVNFPESLVPTEEESELPGRRPAIEKAVSIPPDKPGEVVPPSQRQDSDSRELGLTWVTVPAGEFLMGTKREQQVVDLPEFRITRFPITNQQYLQYIQATRADPKNRPPTHWVDGQIPLGKGDHPVVGVNWHEARRFCAWAGVRLPTEAEWEKAARGSDGRTYPWGNERPTEMLCNCAKHMGDTTSVTRYSTVGSVYGLVGMAGNVWEWTSSLWKPYPYRQDDGRENLEGKERRVVRGGSFASELDAVATTFRRPEKPDTSSLEIGFRVVALAR